MRRRIAITSALVIAGAGVGLKPQAAFAAGGGCMGGGPGNTWCAISGPGGNGGCSVYGCGNGSYACCSTPEQNGSGNYECECINNPT